MMEKGFVYFKVLELNFQPLFMQCLPSKTEASALCYNVHSYIPDPLMQYVGDIGSAEYREL